MPQEVVVDEPLHAVERVVASTHPSLSALQWQVVKSALNKANGRVVIARRKVSALRKEADEKAAMAIVSNGAAMEVDAETFIDQAVSSVKRKAEDEGHAEGSKKVRVGECLKQNYD